MTGLLRNIWRAGPVTTTPEKQKDKKHKKDKEKREDKEKKEKDRSDGKYKDKKDKKREKDRDKDKDKSNKSEEKKFSGHPEGQNGEKNMFEKKLPRKSEGHSEEEFISKEKGRDKDRSSFSSEEKLGEKFSGFNGKKISQNSHLVEDIRDAKFMQELGRRVRDEGVGAGNRLVKNIMGIEQKRDEEMVRLVARTNNALVEEKEKNKRSDGRKLDVQGIRDERSEGDGAGNKFVEKFMGTEQKRDEGMVRLVSKTANALAKEKEKNTRSDDRKFDVQGIKDEIKSSGDAMVKNIDGAVNASVEGIPRQVEGNTERRDVGKEKNKEIDSENKTRDKRKDKDREKKCNGKDMDRDKEDEKKKKEERMKAMAKGQHRNLEADNMIGNNKDDPMSAINPKESDAFKGAVVEENHRKRKDCETN